MKTKQHCPVLKDNIYNIYSIHSIYNIYNIYNKLIHPKRKIISRTELACQGACPNLLV